MTIVVQQHADKVDKRADVYRRPSTDDAAVSIGFMASKISHKRWYRELMGLMFANQHG